MKPKKPQYIYEQNLTKNFACTIPLEQAYLNPQLAQIKINQRTLRVLIKALKKENRIEPLKAVKRGEKYEIIDGLHRFTASVQTGQKSIPVIIMDKEEAKRILEERKGLVEQPKDVLPIESEEKVEDEERKYRCIKGSIEECNEKLL